MMTYSYEKYYIPQLKIIISGKKVYEKSASMSGYDMICYKLYDEDEYVIASEQIYLRSLSLDDKFKDDSTVIYDITLGETYKLVLSEYNW